MRAAISAGTVPTSADVRMPSRTTLEFTTTVVPTAYTNDGDQRSMAAPMIVASRHPPATKYACRPPALAPYSPLLRFTHADVQSSFVIFTTRLETDGSPDVVPAMMISDDASGEVSSTRAPTADATGGDSIHQ